MTMKINADKFLTAASVIYIVLPVIMFFAGWLNYAVSIPTVLICAFFILCIYSELTHDECRIIDRSSAKFWSITLVIMCVWVILSGIGNLSYQNWDFIARNPIYRDLCTYNWPVMYDFSEQTPYVQSIIGSGKAALSYYFSWWLPPAFICKIFSFGQTGQNICLYAWAVLGVFLVTYNLCRYFRRRSFAIVLIFVFFSGLDVAGYLIKCMNDGSEFFPYFLYRHIEWWPGAFQLSSNTTLLFWVFNQSIPSWVIMSLLLQLKSSKNFMALSSLIFAYSPWAALGIVPIAICALFESRENFRSAFTFQNISVPVVMMIVYGAFYLSGTGIGGQSHVNITGLSSASGYVCMIFLEVLIFLAIMGKTARKYRFYYATIAVLLLFPMYTLIQYSFHIRGTIPALFILMMFVMKFLTDESNPLLRSRKILMSIILLIGAFTGLGEINRSMLHDVLFLIKEKAIATPIVSKFSKSALEHSLLREQVYSIGRMKTQDESTIKLFQQQFFTYDYEHTFFFGKLGKDVSE